MSSTGRGGEQRDELDFYPTFSWVVRRFVEAMGPLPGGKWLEPAAGTGSIIRALGTEGREWWAAEINRAHGRFLRHLLPRQHVLFGNFLEAPVKKFDVIITNPPYSLAYEFIQKSLTLAPLVIMLLRLNFLGSIKRRAWFHDNMPDVYVLPNRPSFKLHGRTDSTEYAWMVWNRKSRGRHTGTVRILPTTPETERRLARQEAQQVLAAHQ